MYFVTKLLIDAEIRYYDFERIVLALRTIAKKLRPYFQAHTIFVLTNLPIRAILHKPDASDWLLKWAIELSEFDIEYHPRSAIKGFHAIKEYVASPLLLSQPVSGEDFYLYPDASTMVVLW